MHKIHIFASQNEKTVEISVSVGIGSYVLELCGGLQVPGFRGACYAGSAQRCIPQGKYFSIRFPAVPSTPGHLCKHPDRTGYGKKDKQRQQKQHRIHEVRQGSQCRTHIFHPEKIHNHTFVSYRTCEQASISGTADHLASVIFLPLRHFPIPGNAAFTAVAMCASAHYIYYNN